MSAKSLLQRAVNFSRQFQRNPQWKRILLNPSDNPAWNAGFDRALQSPHLEPKLRELVRLVVDARHESKDMMVALYKSIRDLPDDKAILTVVPLAPLMLTHFSHSTMVKDQEHIVNVCDDLIGVALSNRTCVCRREPLLQDKLWNLCCKGSFDAPANKSNCSIYDRMLARKLITHQQVALARLGRPEDALKVEDHYRNQEFFRRPDLYEEHVLCAIMSAFLANGQAQDAANLYFANRNKLHRSQRAANLYLQAKLKSQDLIGALEFFQGLPKETINITHTNTIMNALVDAELYDDALRIYEGVQPHGKNKDSTLHPDSVTHTIAVKCLCRSNDVIRAMQVFRSQFAFTPETVRMTRSTQFPVAELAEKRPSASAVAYRTLISTFCQIAHTVEPRALDMALDLHREMLVGERLFLAATTFQILALCVRQKHRGLARSVFDTFLDAGGVPDVKMLDLVRPLYPSTDLADRLSRWACRFDAAKKRQCPELMTIVELYQSGGSDANAILDSFICIADQLAAEPSWRQETWRRGGQGDAAPPAAQVEWRRVRRTRVLRRRHAAMEAAEASEPKEDQT